MLKRSKYSLFWETEGNGVLLGYNFLTNGFVKVGPAEKAKVLAYFNDPESAEQNDPLVKGLMEGSFLIDSDFDEMTYLRYRNNRGRYNSQTLALSLVPTTGCNFACNYCYEKIADAKSMTAEVQHNIINWLEKSAAGYKNISITWYGGEPLLCSDMVVKLSQKIRDIGRENKAAVILSMVTNGYLLNPRMTDQLAGLDFESIQITIDGMGATHDARRPLKSGQGTYDRIMENISYAAAKLKNITIRVNLDRENCGEAGRLMDYFIQQNWGKKVKFYFAKVEDYTEACSDYAGKCLTLADFSREDVELSRMALAKDLMLAKIPGIKFNFCGGDFVNGYVIGPEGEIHKCWETIGMKEQVVGQLKTEGPEVNGRFYDWVTYDPIDRECADCQFLPACMGGCPAARFLKRKNKQCNPLKHNFKDMLEIYYNYKIKHPDAELVPQE